MVNLTYKMSSCVKSTIFCKPHQITYYSEYGSLITWHYSWIFRSFCPHVKLCFLSRWSTGRCTAKFSNPVLGPNWWCQWQTVIWWLRCWGPRVQPLRGRTWILGRSTETWEAVPLALSQREFPSTLWVSMCQDKHLFQFLYVSMCSSFMITSHLVILLDASVFVNSETFLVPNLTAIVLQ